MDAPVWIFSSAHDPHASAVAWALARNRIPVALSPSIRATEQSRLSIHFSEDGEAADQFLIDERDTAHAARSIWYRRPKLPEAGHCLEADKAFIEGQWKYLQKNLFDLADSALDALWINRPRAAELAESKLAQLHAARAAGLRVPATVIGNRASDVAALIARWGQVVFKTFYPQSWVSETTGRNHKMSVAMLDGDSDLPEASIGMSPGIYQRYIDKSCDLRITIMGGQIFAVRMLKASGEAYFDWRPHGYDDDMRVEPYIVSTSLEQQLRDLMHRLGIVFGCIDMVVGRDDQLYFLEVNQAGQFLFLEEQLPQLQVLRAMTAMLATGHLDYGIHDSIDVSFSDYLASDDYQALIQARTKIDRAIAVEP